MTPREETKGPVSICKVFLWTSGHRLFISAYMIDQKGCDRGTKVLVVSCANAADQQNEEQKVDINLCQL